MTLTLVEASSLNLLCTALTAMHYYIDLLWTTQFITLFTSFIKFLFALNYIISRILLFHKFKMHPTGINLSLQKQLHVSSTANYCLYHK